LHDGKQVLNGLLCRRSSDQQYRDRYAAPHKNQLTIAVQHGIKRRVDRPRISGASREPPIFGANAMAAADTVKSTVEQFTSAGNVAFKDAVEKSLSALNEANGYSKKNLEAVIASVTAATKGAEALGAQAVAYSKKSVEEQVAAAKSLSSAKSIQEVVELQTAFAKSALEGYIAEVTKASETVAASVKDSLKPLNERVTAVVERLQAAR
jgi:phasin family protein